MAPATQQLSPPTSVVAGDAPIDPTEPSRPPTVAPDAVAGGAKTIGWRPAGALASWTIALFAVIAVVDIVSVFVSLHRASIADRYGDDPSITLATIKSADDAVQAMGITQSLVTLALAVLFIIWLYRGAKRVAAVRPDALRYRPGWAIGGWFVPIWSLFRPKQMVDDVWRGTRDLREMYFGVPAWVHVWWAGWLISGIFGRLFLGQLLDAQSLHDFVFADRVGAASDAIDVVTAVLAALVVAALSRRLTRLPPAPVRVPGTEGWRFNPPPGWPDPPIGWAPPPGWQPDPAWPAPPPGWKLWLRVSR